MSTSFSVSASGSTPNPEAPLKVDGLSVQIAGTPILTNLSVTVAPGQRLGLIGENGSGKSTLLHAIHGTLPSGATTVGAIEVGTPSHPARVGLLHQQVPFKAEDTIGQALESAVAAERQVARDLEAAADPYDEQAYTQAIDLAERLDIWETDSRISATLAGLGLSHIPTDRPTGALSGGQRARLSLAWLLLNRPDVLLLDEPTNHLDDHATDYLVSVLNAWKGPVLFASHDRAFLDTAASGIVDLDPAPTMVGEEGGLTRYTGNYTDYLAAREDVRERWERQYRDEQAELKRLRAGVRDNHTVGHVGAAPRTEGKMAAKFYADRNAKVVSRRVNDSRSRLEKLEEEQVRKPPKELTFAGLTASSRAGRTGDPVEGPVLVASSVAVDGRLPATSVSVNGSEKLLVTGANGSGKSTLLSVLAGTLAPDEGSVSTASVSVGHLTQDVSLPDPHDRGADRTVERTYRDLVGDELADEVPLSTFGLIHPRDETRPLEELSLGQQRRVELAVLLADPPEVLLLDEPDNHLSLSLVTALEQAIPSYPGAVVVASHDRWLRNRWRNKRLGL
ncbi:MAG TPA: ATP-binding cassette domain-containing protein [Candidatus Corynebacterium faecigallinarum]|uniref:ATP-binding cassette domain-containing protein n=2 Tax=Corynebacterium TaxID=1716 RepID=A0A9D1RT84_9CORY|nr:ATP-binding cassette domain-containing protein [Candidatus Corynebacterium avicola]HJC84280.1 ATP-binding cassette domain-containing protein [Candidatus Corynebacterium faecigallinarum]